MSSSRASQKLYESGRVSAGAFHKYLGATSVDGRSLVADDGNSNAAAFTADHLDAPQHQKPGRSLGAILANPQGDYGPADQATRGHIDKRANKRGDRESKYSKQRTRVDEPRRASVARVKANSAHEYYDSAWYGHPESRQES
jgi:hypothetical protein